MKLKITEFKIKLGAKFIFAFMIALYFTTSANAQQQWWTVGQAGFSAGGTYYTSIAIDPSGTPYVAYQDGGNSFKATVMKFDGTSWVTVGKAGFSAGAADYTSIAIDPSGAPYVAYQDEGNSYKATVMKFDGTSWVTVGQAGFSAGEAYYTSIAIDKNGTPYVAYQDRGNLDKATVMKYNGTSWVTVGQAGFSADEADYTSIAIDENGAPYVVYEDYGNLDKATVMKYNGTSWVTVGQAGFSAGEADYTSIAIDPSGAPYVVYEDYGNSYKATVMKFDGTSWVGVGQAGFSADIASYTSIAIDPGGAPYVVYEDLGNSYKATVMKYNGTSWVTVGEAGFSADAAVYTSIAIDPGGAPYVAYQDYGNSSKATVMEFATAHKAAIDFYASDENNNSAFVYADTVTEGEPYTIKAQTLPSNFSDAQPLYDALVGSRFYFQLGSLNQDIKIYFDISDINSSTGKYTFDGYFFDATFDIQDFSGTTNFPEPFDMNPGKYAVLKVYKTAALNTFMEQSGIDITKALDFAYQVAGDNNFDTNGIQVFDSSGSVTAYISHFSKIIGGSKSTITGVKQAPAASVPTKFALMQNYPNPFNPTTIIQYAVPRSSYVELKVYNMLGQKIAELVNGNKAAGTYNVTFNPGNISSGIYIYQMRAGNVMLAQKMIYMK
jgi:Secretion system C-terminal sorting domain